MSSPRAILLPHRFGAVCACAVTLHLALQSPIPAAGALRARVAAQAALPPAGTPEQGVVWRIEVGLEKRVDRRPWRVERYSVPDAYRTCQDLLRWLDLTLEEGNPHPEFRDEAGNRRRAFALTRPRFAVRYAASYDGMSRIWQGTITIFLDLDSTHVVLPEWEEWEGARPADVAAWKRMLAGLEVHEQGHRELVYRSLERFEPESTELSISFRADGPDEAKRRAEEILGELTRDLLRDVTDDHQRESDSYDRVTDHGRRQSAGPAHGYPGGEDIWLFCKR